MQQSTIHRDLLDVTLGIDLRKNDTGVTGQRGSSGSSSSSSRRRRSTRTGTCDSTSDTTRDSN